MKPGGGGAPPKAVQDALESSFGSVDAFKTQFKDAAVSQFGSGWAWLVHGEDGKLKIVKTPNAISPICFGQVPLLTCDVWEHAYCAFSPLTWLLRSACAC
jgi:Fe-Mn family superoxide dismutase